MSDLTNGRVRRVLNAAGFHTMPPRVEIIDGKRGREPHVIFDAISKGRRTPARVAVPCRLIDHHEKNLTGERLAYAIVAHVTALLVEPDAAKGAGATSEKRDSDASDKFRD